jgi:hypothetical protein
MNIQLGGFRWPRLEPESWEHLTNLFEGRDRDRPFLVYENPGLMKKGYEEELKQLERRPNFGKEDQKYKEDRIFALNHFIKEGYSGLTVCDSVAKVLRYDDSAIVMKQWVGAWRSDWFAFTLRQLKDYRDENK